MIKAPAAVTSPTKGDAISRLLPLERVDVTPPSASRYSVEPVDTITAACCTLVILSDRALTSLSCVDTVLNSPSAWARLA